MVPDSLIQDFQNYLWRHLILWRIFAWLIEYTHTIISKHLKASEKRRVPVKTPTSAKTRNSDDGHLQPRIFAQETERKRI